MHILCGQMLSPHPGTPPVLEMENCWHLFGLGIKVIREVLSEVENESFFLAS